MIEINILTTISKGDVATFLAKDFITRETILSVISAEATKNNDNIVILTKHNIDDLKQESAIVSFKRNNLPLSDSIYYFNCDNTCEDKWVNIMRGASGLNAEMIIFDIDETDNIENLKSLASEFRIPTILIQTNNTPQITKYSDFIIYGDSNIEDIYFKYHKPKSNDIIRFNLQLKDFI